MTAKVEEELRQICRKIEETVDTEKIYLFGSYAYGEPNADSDYDLYVVISDPSLRSHDATIKIRKALYPIQEKPLDVLVDHSGNFEKRRMGPTLERKIARDGVLLYERNGLERRMVPVR